MKRVINFYKTEDGKCPVEEYLDSLPGKTARKITWVLQIIEDFDQIPQNYFKKLVNTDNIYEVRIQQGSDTYRLLGFFHKNALFILTNGFTKKTQKTPENEIKLAEKYKADYLRRNI